MSSEFRHIVRLAGRDLDGRKKVAAAIADIRGVGQNMAFAILNLLKIDQKNRLGNLSDKELEALEASLKDLSRTQLPRWTLNRRKDLESGLDMHLMGGDLEFAIRGDIERDRETQSWRGIRHTLGLKVRGQRTRTSGRTGMSVGVKKAAVVPTLGEAKKEEPK